MPSSRAASVPDTRARLLESAVRCIQDNGYAATTAREVAGLADANLASIGYHFGGMEALLDEALGVATDRWLGPLLAASALGEGSSVRERVSSSLSAFIASLPEHRHTVIGFFEALARVERSEGLRRRLAADYEALRAGLIDMVAGGSAYGETVAGGASAVIALYDGVMVQWLLDPDRAIDADIMLDGLALVLRPAIPPQTARRVEEGLR